MDEKQAKIEYNNFSDNIDRDTRLTPTQKRTAKLAYADDLRRERKKSK